VGKAIACCNGEEFKKAIIINNQNIIKKIFAYLLVSIAIFIVFRDAYDIENGWVHPEMIFYHIKFLTNSTFEKIELSFNMQELKKVFWWEEVFDGGQNRLLTGLFALFDVKFRPWLFQYIAPNPAVSASWLFTLFLTPLLLYNFIRRHIKLGIFGSTAITVLFIGSPTTVGNTFELFHPSKILVVFFYVLLLNMFMVVNNMVLSSDKNSAKQISFFVVTAMVLFLSLFTDPYIYAIFVLIPLFFPKIFIVPTRVRYLVSYYRNNFFVKARITGFRRIFGDLINCFGSSRLKTYAIYGSAMLSFFLSVFLVLPHLANFAGFKYEFMQVFRHQIDSGAPAPYLHFLNWHYYIAILINVYWFIVANIGLRDCLPISIANLSELDPGQWWALLNFKNAIFCSLLNVICWAFYLFLKNRYGLLKNLFVMIIALYLVTAWITLVHGHHAFLVPYSTFIYGSPFTVVFALFLATVLYSFRKNRKVYLILVIAVFTSAIFTYREAKEINKVLKGKWYEKDHIDMVYKESRQFWNDIKRNDKVFDPKLLKIDEEVRNNYLKTKYPHDKYYTEMWKELSKNENYLKAMHFAAFGND